MCVYVSLCVCVHIHSYEHVKVYIHVISHTICYTFLCVLAFFFHPNFKGYNASSLMATLLEGLHMIGLLHQVHGQAWFLKGQDTRMLGICDEKDMILSGDMQICVIAS